MFILSIKQLLRQPAKALLFFLLMAGSTALVVTGLVMTMENNARIQTVEDTYATVGYIQQYPVSVKTTVVDNPCMGVGSNTNTEYGDPIFPDELEFPGADYIVKSEYRPYYVSVLPEVSATAQHRYIKRHILEFTPLEDSEDGHMVDVEVTKVLYSVVDSRTMNASTRTNDEVHVGDVIPLCTECRTSHPFPLKAGQRYVSTIDLLSVCNTGRHEFEYQTFYAPRSQQHDAQGNDISEGFYTEDWTGPNGEKLDVMSAALRPVPDDSYYDEGQPGYKYLMWAEIYEKEDHTFTTAPVNSLEVLKPWHEKRAEAVQGREITPEEFESGAAVCMLPDQFATINQLKVGDKISLSFLCSYYGETGFLDFQGMMPYDFNYLFNAQGERFEPFWEAEYEIVGTYSDFLAEIWVDTFIIPAKSVGASDENNIAYWEPMSEYLASFQIPNGSIEEFNNALHAAMGTRADYLGITYDDRGYSEIMKSLNASREMARLLLIVGVLAALAIVALLLYFFVAKEKKRTAIERSLGMTKRQCRVVMLAALMVMTLLAAGIGSLCGGLMLDTVEELTTVQGETADELDSQYIYDTSYSLWAKNRELAGQAKIDVAPPVAVYFVVPVAVLLLVYVLALGLMAYGFSIDPIYLLSTKDRE